MPGRTTPAAGRSLLRRRGPGKRGRLEYQYSRRLRTSTASLGAPKREAKRLGDEAPGLDAEARQPQPSGGPRRPRGSRDRELGQNSSTPRLGRLNGEAGHPDDKVQVPLARASGTQAARSARAAEV